MTESNPEEERQTFMFGIGTQKVIDRYSKLAEKVNNNKKKMKIKVFVFQVELFSIRRP